jgi:hypothetical protein
MEETRMAIVETLKVTNKVDDKVDRMDDKVTGLIGSGKNAFFCLLIPEHGG